MSEWGYTEQEHVCHKGTASKSPTISFMHPAAPEPFKYASPAARVA